jgi:ribosomal protein S18 acetylase RimI-like enzyme
MAVKIYVDTTGKIVASFPVKEWLRIINEFVEEGADLIVQRKKTLAEEVEWHSNMIKKIQKGKSFYVVAVDEKKHTSVGWCEARKIGESAEEHNVEFGLAVRKPYRGKGLGKALLTKAIKEAKKHFKPKNLWIDVFASNEIAYNLYKKVGFVEVARLKNYYKKANGEFTDKIIMRYQES